MRTAVRRFGTGTAADGGDCPGVVVVVVAKPVAAGGRMIVVLIRIR